MSTIIGIDLGTTNSIATSWKDGRVVPIPNTFGEYLTPSVVGLDNDGNIIVGKTARERLVTHPDKTIASFKQYMGTEKKFFLADKAFFAEDLSALVLKQLKQDAETFLGISAEEAVISVPAYFNDTQRSATKIAGQLAGLKVDRIINEPSAAAIAFQHKHEQDGTFLVVDFGGGTLDISVVDMFENIVDILAVSGDNHLGGDNINRSIVDGFFDKHPSLKGKLSLSEQSSLELMADQCKRALSSSPISCLIFHKDGENYEFQLSNDILLKLAASVFSRIKAVVRKALKDCNKSIEEIDDIILVGGSCAMPLVQEYISYLTKKLPLVDIDPNLAIAIGMGIISGIKMRDGDIRDMVLTDICPFTLGLAVEGRQMGVTYSPIIERNSSLPVSQMGTYVTTADNQLSVILRILQGESPNSKDNLELGTLEVKVPPKPAGEVKIYVRFTYDINGILEVDAYCKEFDQRVTKLIVNNKNLSQEDVAQRLKYLQQFKVSSASDELNQYLISKADRLYEESSGFTRNIISLQKNTFVKTINTLNQHPSAVSKEQKRFDEFLNKVDVFSDGLTPDYYENGDDDEDAHGRGGGGWER